MNYGALVFLAGFIALAASWFGFVLTPQLQIGRDGLTNILASAEEYPQQRPGMAAQGEQVYRANGCVSCHSQQVRQTGTVFDLVISEVGTNQPAVIAALKAMGSSLEPAALAGLPQDAVRGVTKTVVDEAEKELKPSGAKYEIRIRPIGADIDRGWGRRGSVAQDYLQDSTAMLGRNRFGPDLMNVGIRQPDVKWHLKHLYAPASVVPHSTMPAYRFLFEKRKIAGQPSPEALDLTGEFAPEAGYEIVPTEEAKQLAAYLVNLRSDAPLFVAPMSASLKASASPEK